MAAKWLLVASGVAAAATAAAIFALSSEESSSEYELRAALDVGSGSMKLVVAKVHKASSKIKSILASDYIELLLAHDLQKSENNCLSEAILLQGIAIIKHLVRICDQLLVPRQNLRGVATQVFRTSSNGGQFLQRIFEEFGVRINVISQAEEAVLGFQTGLALSHGLQKHELVVWDSGGASFQFTAMTPAGTLLSYVGPLGASSATMALIERVQKRSFKEVQSPNPVPPEQLGQLRTVLAQLLPSPSPELLAAVARTGGVLTGIGEATSLFSIAALATGKMEYTAEDVWAAAQQCADLSDEQLERFPQAAMVVPKLVLLYVAMSVVAGRRVRYQASTGVCAGLLGSPTYWV